MKKILFLLLPIISFGQGKYALIDKHLKLPILYTDSVTVGQIEQGFFPVQNKNVDTLIANLYYLKKMMEKQQRSKAQGFELRSASTVFSISSVPFAYGDRYNIVVTTTTENNMNAKMLLANAEQPNRIGAKRLDNIIEYLSRDKSFFKFPNELNPVRYNVTVVVAY